MKRVSAFNEITDILIHMTHWSFMYNSRVVFTFCWKSPLHLRSEPQPFHVQLRKKCPIHPRQHINIISKKWMTLSTSPLIVTELQRTVAYLNISTLIKYLISVPLKILWFVNTRRLSGNYLDMYYEKSRHWRLDFSKAALV